MNIVRPTHAIVDLKAIEFNFRQIKQLVGKTDIMAVVKANAYGHGDVRVAHVVLNAGAKWLGVATAEEGVTLRTSFPDVPIMAFSPPVVDQLPLYVENAIDIDLCNYELAEALNTLAGVLKLKAGVHIKIDSGMGRVGVLWQEALAFIKRIVRLPHIELHGVYTHFATADEADKTFSYIQLERFQSVLDKLKEEGIAIPMIHCANSGAILDIPESYFDIVRPGLMLYGYYPSHQTSERIPLKPALSLHSRINHLKTVDAGVPLSYGRLYTTKSKTRIAAVTIGYADGYSKLLTGKASALINGNRFPVVGAICMDQILVDVGMDVPVHLGDRVTLLGSDGVEKITAWDIADALGTIPYEVLSLISPRVPRIYVE